MNAVTPIHARCAVSTDRISPKSMWVMSPENEADLEVMITPSASIPTNNSPTAVSGDRRVLRCTTLTPPIITSAPTAVRGTPAPAVSTVRGTPAGSWGEPIGLRVSTRREGATGTNCPYGSSIGWTPLNQPSTSIWRWAERLVRNLA